ncbi:MAG: hypothetical protein GY811_11685 [Myxococcales bacterium]|nr:hypothetical protein [Myxococcales bacterium]
MRRFAKVFVALCLTAGLTACGGGYSGFILPVESDLNPWVAPEADELISDGGPAQEDDGDYEDYEDEEGDAEAPAATETSPTAAKAAK